MRLFLLGVRLRWRLTANRLRKGGMGLFVLVLIGCALLASGGVATFGAARGLEADDRLTLFVLAFTLVVLSWMFVPLIVGGADETVDPTRLALLPLRRRELAAVLAGAASCGPAGLAVVIGLLGVPIGVATSHPMSIGLLVVAVPVVFGLGLGIARLMAALLVRAQRSRRGRDLAVIVSGAAGVALWLLTQSVGPLLEADSARGSAVVAALAWAPPGWAARGVVAAGQDRFAASAGWLGLTATAAGAALYGWAAVTARLFTGSERTVGVRADSGRPPLGRANTPVGAALAKELRYVVRSPGKRVQLMLGTLMGVGFAVIQAAQAGDGDNPKMIFFALWGAVFVISASFNVIGFDSGSLWLEVVSGGLRREQLLARSVAWFPVLLFPVVLATLVIGGWLGQWRYAVMTMALAVTVTACGIGVGVVVSTFAATPQADGDNPFSWRQGASGRGCLVGIFSVGGMAAVAALAAPVIVPCTIAADRWWATPLALAGIGYGFLVWQLGVAVATRRVAGRGPELIAELSPRSVA